MCQVLNLRQRLLARHIARDAWIASHGNGDEAKLLAEADCRVRGLDPATVILIIKLCIEIWIWWQSKNIDEPSVVPSSLEPFDWGDDRDD
jgi:hypothetical protein